MRSRIDRRSLERALIAGLILLAAVPLLTSCESKHQPQPVLSVLSRMDYLCLDRIAEFEHRFGCAVKIFTVADDAELHRVLKQASLDVDIVIPSSHTLETLHQEGFLRPLSFSQLPNYRSIDRQVIDQFLGLEMSSIGVPYFLAPSGLAVREELIGAGGPPSHLGWNALQTLCSTPGTAASILNDPREAIAAALLASGKQDVNSPAEGDLKAAEETLERWLSAGVKVNGQSYRYRFEGDSRRISQAHLGDVLPLVAGAATRTSPGGGTSVAFFLPQEGYVVDCDALAITSASKQPELAHAFINFFCDKQVCAKNVGWNLFYAPTEAARTALSAAPPEWQQGRVNELLDGRWFAGGKILRHLPDVVQARYDLLWERIRKKHLESLEE